jgi:uncharacterized protein (TIGR02246 family)
MKAPNMTTPQDLLTTYFARFNGGEIDGTASLYEPTGVLVAQPAMVAEGTAAVRAALAQFFSMRPQLKAEAQRVIVAGDVALALTKWTLEGAGPDGPVRMNGTTTDVLRRHEDGGWRVAIDNPWGIGALEVGA